MAREVRRGLVAKGWVAAAGGIGSPARGPPGWTCSRAKCLVVQCPRGSHARLWYRRPCCRRGAAVRPMWGESRRELGLSRVLVPRPSLTLLGPPAGLQGRGAPGGGLLTFLSRWERAWAAPCPTRCPVEERLRRGRVSAASCLLESWLGRSDCWASGRDWSRRPGLTLPEVGCLGPWFPRAVAPSQAGGAQL